MRAPIGVRCLSSEIPGPPGFRPPAPVPAPQLQLRGRRSGGNPGTPAHPCPARRGSARQPALLRDTASRGTAPRAQRNREGGLQRSPHPRPAPPASRITARGAGCRSPGRSGRR